MDRTKPQRDGTKILNIITIIGVFLSSFYTGSYLAVILAFFLQIFIHEFGHLIFGLISGYKFYSYRFLIFTIYRNKDNKIRFKLFGLTGTAGQCLMIPPEKKIEDTPFLLYNMGGVILNLITMPFFAAAYFTTSDEFIKGLFISLVFMGFTHALTNGIPLYFAYIANDGMNTLNIYRSARARYVFKLTLDLHVKIENGMHYSDIPDELLVIEDDDYYNAISATIPYLAAYVAFMKKDFEKAKAISEKLNSFDSQALKLHKMFANMMILYCEAVSETKKSILLLYENKDVVRFMRRSPTSEVLRAKYAIEKLVNGEEVKAAKAKKQFESMAKRTKNKEMVEIERSLYDYVDQIYIWRTENKEPIE